RALLVGRWPDLRDLPGRGVVPSLALQHTPPGFVVRAVRKDIRARPVHPVLRYPHRSWPPWPSARLASLHRSSLRESPFIRAGSLEVLRLHSTCGAPGPRSRPSLRAGALRLQLDDVAASSSALGVWDPC